MGSERRGIRSPVLALLGPDRHRDRHHVQELCSVWARWGLLRLRLCGVWGGTGFANTELAKVLTW